MFAWGFGGLLLCFRWWVDDYEYDYDYDDDYDNDDDDDDNTVHDDDTILIRGGGGDDRLLKIVCVNAVIASRVNDANEKATHKSLDIVSPGVM